MADRNEPSLTALADGGFVLAAKNVQGHGSEFWLGFFTDHVTQTGEAAVPRWSETRPGLYDSSHGVVVSYLQGTGGTSMREVVGEDGAVLVAPAPVTQIQSGTVDHTSGPDDVMGGPAADTLFGGAGYDVLVGGPARDLFEFAVDGSVDQAINYDPANDAIAIVDSSGVPLRGFYGSVLALDLRSHVVSWDGDGDNGAQAPVAVAVLPGADRLVLGSGADIIRTINPDGSRTDLSFQDDDYPQILHYDAAGHLLTRHTSYARNPGWSTDEWFDNGSQAWDHLVATRSPGGLTHYSTYWDDGSLVDWSFDPNNTETWQRKIEEYRADGPGRSLVATTIVMDDGTYTITWDDASSSEPWRSRTAAYDPDGALTNYNVFYDNGDHVLWFFDPHDAQPWRWRHEDYDGQGRIVEIGIVYDDGFSKLAHFDVGNTQSWDMMVDVFDPTGRQTGHWIYYDDGTVVV